MALREDLEQTIFETLKGYNHPSERKMKIVDGVEDYLRNGEGDYKYLFDEG